jgi:flagellar basal-body rod modification protein FlgD
MMHVSAATGAVGPALPAQSVGGVDDFMTLLVAQLRAQDPLSPMDPSEFMSQLAQLQSVAELQKIRGLLADAAVGSAVDLIGRTVRWMDRASGEITAGEVEGVEMSGGACHLVVGESRLAPGDVISVSR